MNGTRGWLEPMILATLELEELHGYAIAAKLEAAGADEVQSGTLYPVLKKLAKADLVDARWVTDTAGPARKVYALTDDGRHALSEGRRQWERTRRFVDLVMSGAPAPGGPS